MDEVFPTGGALDVGKNVYCSDKMRVGCSSPHTTFIINWKLLHCNKIEKKSFSDLITLLLLC